MKKFLFSLIAILLIAVSCSYAAETAAAKSLFQIEIGKPIQSFPELNKFDLLMGVLCQPKITPRILQYMVIKYQENDGQKIAFYSKKEETAPEGVDLTGAVYCFQDGKLIEKIIECPGDSFNGLNNLLTSLYGNCKVVSGLGERMQKRVWYDRVHQTQIKLDYCEIACDQGKVETCLVKVSSADY